MPKSLRLSGYQHPTPIRDYPLKCYCVLIPDALEYRAAFRGQIYELTRYETWERTSFDDRTQTAEYMREVLLPQIEDDMACGCLMFRNSPTDSLMVQTSCDNGATWLDAFRLDGGGNTIYQQTNVQIETNITALVRLEILNRYDGSDVTTININCPDDFYNGDNSADRNMALCMACNGYVRKIVQSYQQRLLAAFGLTTLLGGLLTIINPVVGIPAIITLSVLEAAAWDAIQDDAAINDVVCCMKDGLTGQAVTRTKFQESLNSCGFAVGSHAAIVRDVVADSFGDMGNWAAFLDGLGNAYLLAQAGVEDCPCDTWCHEFDFTVSDQGFDLYTNTYLDDNFLAGGVYVPGEGWQMTLYTPYPNTRYTLAIHGFDVAGMERIRTVRYIYYYAGVSSHALHGAIATYDIGAPGSQFVFDLEQQAPGAPTEHDKTFTIQPAISGNGVTFIMAKDFGTAGILRKVILCGDGIDPFL